MGTTSIAEFIEEAWNEHGDDARGVAARLELALPLLRREPARTGEFVALAEHVVVAHLGDAHAMGRWVDRLAPLALEHPDAGPPLASARLAVGLLRGEPVDVAGQPPASVVRAHGCAASGAAAQGDMSFARDLLERAESHTRAGDTDAVKALAAVANNLASQLLDAPREPQADALMMDAAELAQRRWHQAGTWLHAERSDYLLALVAAAVGNSAKAMRHAGACLSLCTAHGADAFERFFAHEALARAALAAGHRAGAADASARMRELVDEIEDLGSRNHAMSVWDKLQASLGAP